TQRDLVPKFVAALIRAVVDVMVVQVAARRTSGRHASMAISYVSAIPPALRKPRGIVPGCCEVFERRQQSDPSRHAPAARYEHPGHAERNGLTWRRCRLFRVYAVVRRLRAVRWMGVLVRCP